MYKFSAIALQQLADAPFDYPIVKRETCIVYLQKEGVSAMYLTYPRPPMPTKKYTVCAL